MFHCNVWLLDLKTTNYDPNKSTKIVLFPWHEDLRQIPLKQNGKNAVPRFFILTSFISFSKGQKSGIWKRLKIFLKSDAQIQKYILQKQFGPIVKPQNISPKAFLAQSTSVQSVLEKDQVHVCRFHTFENFDPGPPHPSFYRSGRNILNFDG